VRVRVPSGVAGDAALAAAIGVHDVDLAVAVAVGLEQDELAAGWRRIRDAA